MILSTRYLLVIYEINFSSDFSPIVRLKCEESEIFVGVKDDRIVVVEIVGETGDVVARRRGRTVACEMSKSATIVAACLLRAA